MHVIKTLFFLLRRQTERGNGRITFNQSRIDVRTKEPTAIVHMYLCMPYTVCIWLNWQANFTKCESKAPYSRKNWRLPLTSKTPWKWRTDRPYRCSGIASYSAKCVCVCVFWLRKCVCVCLNTYSVPFWKWALNTPELQFSTLCVSVFAWHTQIIDKDGKINNFFSAEKKKTKWNYYFVLCCK